MTIGPIDNSQRKAAKVAGCAYLINFATVMYVYYGILWRLIIRNNAAETARNILAHERLFRIGIAGEITFCVGVFVLLTALYVILKPVNRGLALLAAFRWLAYVFMWLVMTLNLFDALRLLNGADSDCEHLKRSGYRPGKFLSCRKLRPLLRWVAVLGNGIHSLRLPVVQVPLYPTSVSCLRCDRVRVYRGVHLRFLHLSRLRQDC